MIVAIVGSRNITDYAEIQKAIDASGFEVTAVVSGGAHGVDQLAARYAREHNLPLTEFLPDWPRYGRRAGFIRNEYIIAASDVVLAIWDGGSKGTSHSMDIANRLNKRLFVWRAEPTPVVPLPPRVGL